jgi:pimeloyl-ACP methyl ester carboxylesterase
LRRPIDAFRIARFGLGVVEPTAKAYREGDIERGGRIFGTALLGKHGFEAMPEERRRMLGENQAAEVAQMLGAGFPPLRATDVRSILTPTLLVAGKRSPAVLRATLIGELERLLPNADRTEISQASHLMHEENPVEFNQTLLSFLGRH